MINVTKLCASLIFISYYTTQHRAIYVYDLLPGRPGTVSTTLNCFGNSPNIVACIFGQFTRRLYVAHKEVM